MEDLDPRLLQFVACPIDKGPLQWLPDQQTLHNPRLDRSYPVRDGIAVLVVDAPADTHNFGLGAGGVYPASNARSLLNPLRRLIQSPRRTVDAMRLAPDARVLELGSGPGYYSPYLMKATPEGQLVLFDLQAEMLHLARDRTGNRREPSFVQGDATMLPFDRSTFDAVLIAAVLGEVPDKDAALAEVHRVLQPQGTVAIAETRTDSDFITLPALRDLLSAHGLRYVDHRGTRLQYTARFRPR